MLVFIVHDSGYGTLQGGQGVYKVKASNYPEAVTYYLKWRGYDPPDPIRTKEEADAICGDEGLTVLLESDVRTLYR